MMVSLLHQSPLVGFYPTHAFFWDLGASDPSAGLSGSGLYGLRRTAHKGPAPGRTCRTWGQWVRSLERDGFTARIWSLLVKQHRLHARQLFCFLSIWRLGSKTSTDLSNENQFSWLMAMVVIREEGTRKAWPDGWYSRPRFWNLDLDQKNHYEHVGIWTSRVVAYKPAIFWLMWNPRKQETWG